MWRWFYAENTSIDVLVMNDVELWRQVILPCLHEYQRIQLDVVLRASLQMALKELHKIFFRLQWT